MSYSSGCVAAVVILSVFQSVSSKTLPTVDMSQSPELAASSFLDAATQYGFFYLVNHGISTEETQRALQLNRDLYELDIDSKMDLATNESHWGYIEYQHETTDLNKQKEGDTKEGFMLSHNDSNSPRINQWPQSESMQQSQEWQIEVQEYMDSLHLLSAELAQLVAVSLNLSSDFFATPGIRDHSQELLYLLHYPPQQSDPNQDLFGAGSHTDYQLFTILLTDSNPGLQIQHNNEWMDVDYREDAFIVNIADTLHLWSNGMFKSATHRVVLNGATDRYSIPYFVGVNQDLMIDCLPHTVVPGDEQYGECNHHPFRAGDYVKYKFQQTYVDYEDDRSCTICNNLK